MRAVIINTLWPVCAVLEPVHVSTVSLNARSFVYLWVTRCKAAGVESRGCVLSALGLLVPFRCL